MQSHIRIATAHRHNKTVCDDIYCTSPYKIVMPLSEDTATHIVVLSSSAGLLQGDTVHMDVDFGAHSHALLSTQSYEKVFDTQDGCAKKELSIRVGDHAHVRYLPQPTIPFANSRYACTAHMHLAPNSTFFYSDIVSCGRVFMGERFCMQSFQSRAYVYLNDTVVFADNTCIIPKRWDYTKLGLWHDFTHNGLLYAFFPTQAEENAFIALARQKATEMVPHCAVGVSNAQRGICVRVLGDSGQKIYEYFSSIAAMCPSLA
ncbi:MAG: urease accessory protein UreD [Pseudomonadota bacterium]